jgi:hypothetical protein
MLAIVGGCIRRPWACLAHRRPGAERLSTIAIALGVSPVHEEAPVSRLMIRRAKPGADGHMC